MTRIIIPGITLASPSTATSEDSISSGTMNENNQSGPQKKIVSVNDLNQETLKSLREKLIANRKKQSIRKISDTPEGISDDPKPTSADPSPQSSSIPLDIEAHPGTKIISNLIPEKLHKPATAGDNNTTEKAKEAMPKCPTPEPLSLRPDSPQPQKRPTIMAQSQPVSATSGRPPVSSSDWQAKFDGLLGKVANPPDTIAKEDASLNTTATSKNSKPESKLDTSDEPDPTSSDLSNPGQIDSSTAKNAPLKTPTYRSILPPSRESSLPESMHESHQMIVRPTDSAQKAHLAIEDARTPVDGSSDRKILEVTIPRAQEANTDVDIWLELTGYHDPILREKKLRPYKMRKALDEKQKALDAERAELDRLLAEEAAQNDTSQQYTPAQFSALMPPPTSQTPRSPALNNVGREPQSPPVATGAKRPASSMSMRDFSDPKRLARSNAKDSTEMHSHEKRYHDDSVKKDKQIPAVDADDRKYPFGPASTSFGRRLSFPDDRGPPGTDSRLSDGDYHRQLSSRRSPDDFYRGPEPSHGRRNDYDNDHEYRGSESRGHDSVNVRRLGITSPDRPLRVPMKGPQRTRYFLIKSYNVKNILEAQHDCLWVTHRHNTQTLAEAYENSSDVVLFFSANHSWAFQGAAVMHSSLDRSIPLPSFCDTSNFNYSHAFRLRWLATERVKFDHFLHLSNSYNSGEHGQKTCVTYGRDGQEVSEGSGREMLKIFRAFRG